MPHVEAFAGLPSDRGKPLYGQKLRNRLRHEFGSQLTLLAVGGMIPNAACRCELDSQVKDRWDLPVLRFHWRSGANELNQMRHATATLGGMIEAMGGIVGTKGRSEGESVALMHEVGTARMGASATDSVLNSRGHAWDVRNLYVADGASFTGHADKNPTHTIMALAWRAGDHLVDSMTRKEI